MHEQGLRDMAVMEQRNLASSWELHLSWTGVLGLRVGDRNWFYSDTLSQQHLSGYIGAFGRNRHWDWKWFHFTDWDFRFFWLNLKLL